MPQDARPWLAALRNSHNALVNQAKGLTDEQLATPSYCTDWDVSEVLSHLGSGAEISLTGLERAVDHRPTLAREDFPAIWDRWNAMSRKQRAEEVVVWDRRSVSVAEGLDDATLASLRTTFFGMDLRAADMIGIRLGEHVLHTWDVAVTFDPTAELPAASAALLLDRLAAVASRTGKADAAPRPMYLLVNTTGPDSTFTLSIEDSAHLEPVGSSSAEATSETGPETGAETGRQPETGPGDRPKTTGTVTLPTAALVRLVYGRLDAGHTPTGVSTEGDADLDELRAVFAGL